MNLKEYNRIQILLMIDSDLPHHEWIANYSEKFRNIVRKKEITQIYEITKLLYK